MLPSKLIHSNFRVFFDSCPDCWGRVLIQRREAVLVSESKLIDRFQTTVPSPVRQALHLGRKDKIKYTIQADGNVLMSRVALTESDSILGGVVFSCK